MARWNSCNVLDATGETRQLWQFIPSGDALKQTLEAKMLPSEPLPAGPIGKDWQTLYRKKMNVAWLPSNKVFLRALQIPCNDVAEAKGMVELQLEKISTLPTNQIVWNFELMPGVLGPLRTALVVIAERPYVEEFLGKLEGQGYLADRLEVPFVDQLLATKVQHDGVYLYPSPGTDPQWCLAAWFYSGLLQTVSFFHLPTTPTERGKILQDHLHQSAWAGEADGWLTSAPRCFLVAAPETVALWEPLLQNVFETPLQVVAPPPDQQLAVLTARRSVATAPQGDLLPPEFLVRYHQQLVDRIWMRGLGAALAVYLLGVLIYFGLIQVVQFQYDGVDTKYRAAATPFTNAMKLKAQVQVLQEQLDLQFAALECYKAASDLIPEELQLDSMNFSRGKSFTIFGTAPPEANKKPSDYNEALRNAVDAKGQPLFFRVNPPAIITRANQLSWSFACDLKQNENE